MNAELRQKAEWRSQTGLAERDIVLAAPTPVRDASGHLYAIWSTAILFVAEFPVKLVVPRGGKFCQSLVRFAADSGFADRLVVVDPSSADIAAMADIVLLLDEDEVPPVQAAQALDAGKPIVAADTPPARALLGDAAIFVPQRQPRKLSQAILRLIEHPGESAALAQKAHAR